MPKPVTLNIKLYRSQWEAAVSESNPPLMHKSDLNMVPSVMMEAAFLRERYPVTSQCNPFQRIVTKSGCCDGVCVLVFKLERLAKAASSLLFGNIWCSL